MFIFLTSEFIGKVFLMNDIHEKGRVNGKKIALFILYGLITVLLLMFVLSMGDLEEILNTVKNADYRYILAAIGMVALFLGFYPLSLAILTHASGVKIKFFDTYIIGMIEHFFSGITPFATGGQPFQVLCFSKKKVKGADSTCLLLMNFIVYMTTINLFALVSLIYAPRFVDSSTMAWVAVVGFSANFFVLFVAILLATSHRLRNLLCRLIDAMCRVKWMSKFMAPRADGIKQYFINVQDAFTSLKAHKKAFLLAFFTKAIAYASYYATTFFILRALYVDLSWSDFVFIMLASSFAITMVAFFPTPGTSGGVEMAFKTIIAGIAVGSAASVASGGMLVWRLLTYYFVMLVSLMFYIFFEVKMKISATHHDHTLLDTEAADDLQECESEYEQNNENTDMPNEDL